VLVAVLASQTTQSARHHATSPPHFVRSTAEFAALLAPKPFAKAHTAAVCILTVHSAPVVCGSLHTFHKNFIATNPADVFVFAVGGHSAATAAALRDDCFAHLPNFYAIDMLSHAPQLGWQVPAHLQDSALWAGPWPASYRIMGHWRLTSQFDIARLLGYDFVLQVDDDSEFPRRVEERVFDRMEANGLKLAGRAAFPESHEVAVGLPELAKYFLVTEQLEPSPLLYQHCTPANISGLFSDKKTWASAGTARCCTATLSCIERASFLSPWCSVSSGWSFKAAATLGTGGTSRRLLPWCGTCLCGTASGRCLIFRTGMGLSIQRGERFSSYFVIVNLCFHFPCCSQKHV